MQNCLVYIHGKGGDSAESAHYAPLFPDRAVFGIRYCGFVPQDAGAQIREAVAAAVKGYDDVLLVANSIGAFLAMHAGIDALVHRACFISPIVDMEKLILDSMARARVTEEMLKTKKIIPVQDGEELSWDYLDYVRMHPLRWNVPTKILYGDGDILTSYERIRAFAAQHNAELTVMKNAEHWFHTPEQMAFLDAWIRA